MSIYRSIHTFKSIPINKILGRKCILKIQKYIYLATQEFNKLEAVKYQRMLLSLKKEILMIALSQVINHFKKKYIYQNLIIISCLL